MLAIKFPPPAFRMRQQTTYDEIFDPIRKRWLVLTPEEWVRQNMIAFLVKQAQVPSSLIGIEKEIRVGELKKRFDLVVYHRDGQPWLLMECKSMDISLSDRTIGQLLAYFSEIPCRYAVITNGKYTYGWEVRGKECKLLTTFPVFEQSPV